MLKGSKCFPVVQASREADLSLRRKVSAFKKNPNPIEQKSLNQAAFGGETLARMKARFGLADPIEFTFSWKPSICKDLGGRV